MANVVILEQLHATLFEILCEFDRICRKHQIQYFLDSGTALGAVRHGGFIPWDDDIDVGMLRSEYNRFLDIVESELGDNFFLLSTESDPAYTKYHVKIVKKHTLFPEQGTEKLKHRGIYIDIFPFDKVPENEKIRNNYFRKVMRMRDIISLKRSGNTKGKFKLKILNHFLKLIPLSFLEGYLEKVTQIYNHTTSKYVTCLFYKMLVGRKDIFFPISAINPSIEIEFSGRSFMIMNGYDEYLKVMYKDYMQLPPKDKQTFHFDGEIIFNTESDYRN